MVTTRGSSTSTSPGEANQSGHNQSRQDEQSARDALIGGLDVEARRRGRVLALQTLYEADTAKHPAGTVFERLAREEERDEESIAFGRRLVTGVVENARPIDDLLQDAAPAWPLNQMPGVDKALLRLAIFEAIFDNSAAPAKVIIGEAVDLAKGFGSESSAKLVTGVMGTVVSRASPRQEHREA